MTPIVLIGCLIEVGFLALARLGDLRTHIPLLLGIYGMLFVLMLGAYYSKNCSLPLLVFFAIFFRLTLLSTTPSLSDDIYRYDWEGRVQRAGMNPYRYAPSSPELTSLRDTVYDQMNHKDIPAIYPPLAQLAFRIVTYAGGIRAQKYLFFFFDLLTIGLLALWLRHRGVPKHRLLLYAWNPLVILEFAGSGHNDSLAIFLLVGGLYLWDRHQPITSSLVLAGSFLAKYTSVLLVPFFLWKKRWTELVLWLVIVGVGMSPFWAGGHMMQGARHYAENWQFNGSLFTLLQTLLGRADQAKHIVVAVIGGLALYVGKKETDLTHAAYLLMAASLLLAPTLHPWYFCWIVPFLCFYPNPAFLTWNATVILSYTVQTRYLTGLGWTLSPWIPWLEYAPVYGFLIYTLTHPHAKENF